MKKLLCGILSAVLVLTIFSACAETENPTNSTTTQASSTTTTTTTNTTTTKTKEPTKPKKELSDYVGYWYLDEYDLFQWHNGGEDRTAKCELYISEVISDGDSQGVAVALYKQPYCCFTSDYLEVDPKTKTATLETDWFDGTITLTFKSDSIEYAEISDNGKKVSSFVEYTSSDYNHTDVMRYNEIMFKDIYDATYWYAYEFDDNEELEIGELYIKAATTDGYKYTIKFDLSFGAYEAKNVTANIVNNIAKFTLSNGKEGELDFSAISNFGFTDYSHFSNIKLKVDGEHVCDFVDRALSRITHLGKNRDLTEYVGCWFHSDMKLVGLFQVGIGVSEVRISNVNGNKVTLECVLIDAPNVKKVVVEVNGNLGVFRANNYGAGYVNCGVVRFDRDGVFIYTGGLRDGIYRHQRRYSQYDNTDFIG